MEIYSESNFEESLQQGVVLVDFYADWCGPCKVLSPYLEKLAENHDEIKVGKFNVDESAVIPREAGIRSVPTLILYKDGIEVKRNVGVLDYKKLEEFIKVV